MDSLLASKFNTPQGKSQVLIQFNKLSKELCAILTVTDQSTLNNEYFIYHQAEFDFDNDIVIGNADNFKVVDRNSQPIEVYEAALNEAAAEKITDKYTVVRQINIMGRAITTLADRLIENGGEQEFLDELHEMLAYVQEIKRSNEQRKLFYQESPEYKYISIKDVQDANDRQLEGGLHEALGGRPIAGGRVF